jgi:hypothetical protein
VRTRTSGWIAAATLLAAAAVMGCGAEGPPGRGEAWPDADQLFHRDARFLGADGAYSVDLGGGRVLWHFGDSSVGRDPIHPRAGAFFIRNSVAIQTGLDPSRAFLRYYWGWDGDTPRSFLAEPGDGSWFWPMHGVRVDGALLLFYERLLPDGPPGPSRFQGAGWVAVVVDHPDEEPDAWTPRPALTPADDRGVTLGEAVLRAGDALFVYGTRGDAHEVVLARFPVAGAASGDVSRPSYYCGGTFAEGCGPATVIDLGAPEFSVHHDLALERYLFVASTGYGSTGLGWRAAPRPEGPWTEVRDVYRPVESYRDGAFVYAGKAHPELAGGGLVATYVPSSFDDLPPALQDRYYWPHFVRLFAE